MSESPFLDLKGGPIFGVPIKSWSCIQCGGEPGGFALFNLSGDEHPKPSLLFGYALCARCGGLYWDAAGQKAFDALRKSLEESASTPEG